MLGAGFKHDEKLSEKRWEIGTGLINETQNSKANVVVWVLFHSPTHFVIEYLRVDLISPNLKKITIIDGRRDMKEWIGELEDDKINKRMYHKFRPDDKIKYN